MSLEETVTQMMQRLVIMETQNQELNQRLMAAQQQIQQTESTAAAAVAASRQVGRSAPPGPGEQRIDTRLLGRPEMFDSITVRWKDWPIVFRAYMGAAVPLLKDLMKDAEASDAPKLNVSLSNDDEMAASQQLYFVLIMQTKGEPLDIVVNAGNGEGLEAWRLLCLRYEPRVHSRQAGMLLEILSWDFSGDTMLRIEAMERRITEYEKGGDVLSDAIRIGIVMKNLPDGNVKQHLIMNSERLSQWTTFREEVYNIKRAQNAAQFGAGAVPMDVGALNLQQQQQHQKEVVCPVCKKKGHYAKDCWHKDKGKSGKSGHGGKGDTGGKKGDKGGKKGGKGKQAQPGGWKGQHPQETDKHRKCFKCGGVGHMAKECPSKKGVHAIDHAAPPDQPRPSASSNQPAGVENIVGGLFLNM